MNVKELRAMMDSALLQEGMEARQIVAKAPKAWFLPADDVIRFFQPHTYRRPWGFVYSGSVGLEIPALRKWLRANKQEKEGIFDTCFVSYLIINEDVLSEFRVVHGNPVPADLWAGLLRDRLNSIPPTLDELVAAYRCNKEELGWLAHPHQRHAWKFLLKWRDDPDPKLHVPVMQPNGFIV